MRKSFIFVLGLILSSKILFAEDNFDSLKEKAKNGDHAAQMFLGIMYHDGLGGFPVDYAKSIEWYTKSADQGNSMAQHNLGLIYNKGHGVPKNLEKAFGLYWKSAQQGEVKAQAKLGVCYYEGEGVKQNIVLAYVWYKISLENGYTLVSAAIPLLEQEMSPEQLKEAKKLSVTYADLIKQGKPLPTQ